MISYQGMCVLLSYLTLGTLLVRTQVITSIENHLDILQFNFSKHKTTHDGYKEVAVGNSGVVGLQRTVTKGETSLRLLELTNGSVIVQLIFSPSTVLSDCDVSNSAHHIQRLTEHIHSKYSKAAKEGSYAKHYNSSYTQNLTDISLWSERCYSLHNKELSRPANAHRFETDKTSQSGVLSNKQATRFIQIDKIKQKQIETSSRKKRGIMDLTYPGTKWCGKGNSARHYYDLGDNWYTDRCCRDHDWCPEIITALSIEYNYFNYGLLTMSSCSCDMQLKNCLRKAARKHDDSLADVIGHLYFNVIGMTCFNLEEKDHCVQSSFWGRCLQTEKIKVAVFDEVLIYS